MSKVFLGLNSNYWLKKGISKTYLLNKVKKFGNYNNMYITGKWAEGFKNNEEAWTRYKF